MIIRVGSTNPAKIEAVREIAEEYHVFKGAIVQGLKVDSGISEEPLNFGELRRGAVNRSWRRSSAS